VLTNILGGKKEEVKVLPDGSVWKWVTDPIASGEATHGNEPLSDEELVEITNWRFNPGRKATITAVFGDPDFLPFSFLQKGVTCGAAVCRLVRYYGCAYEMIDNRTDEPNPLQDQGLQLLLDLLTTQNQARIDQKLPPLTSSNLAEILSIEAKDRESFFQNYETEPLNALSVEKLRKLMPMPFGTAFLVGKNYLLTNHHVLPNREQANEFLAQFGYERDVFGRLTLPVQYELDGSFFVTNKALDYTLVKLHPDSNLGEAGDRFGYLRMLEDPRTIAPPLTPEEAEARELVSSLSQDVQERLNKPNLHGEYLGLPGEPVNIIQHPKGQPKEIVLSSNRVQQITEDFIRYEADADFSSSGSPVLNQQWQLVGLHHASLADEKFNIVGQEGVRISRITEDLVNQRVMLDFSVVRLRDAIAIIQDCTGERWKMIVFAISAKTLTKAGEFGVREPHAKTLEMIAAHQKTQELAESDSAWVDAEPIKVELMTFAQDSIKEVDNTLKAFEYLGDLIAPISPSDNIATLEAEAEAIQTYALNIRRFLEDYVEILLIQRAYK
jgi:hypothetical protein